MSTFLWLPREQPDLGPYCLDNRLPKNISRWEEQTTKVVTGELRVNCSLIKITCGCGLPINKFLPFCELRILCNNNCCSSLSIFSCLCSSSVAPKLCKFCSVLELVSNNLPNVALNSFETKFGTWMKLWIFSTSVLHITPDNCKKNADKATQINYRCNCNNWMFLWLALQFTTANPFRLGIEHEY